MVHRCMQVACILTLVALLLSWLLPTQSQGVSGKAFWDQLDNAWNNILNGRLSLQNVGSLTQPYQTPSNFFSDQLTISGNVRLPTGEVLYYTSPQLLPHYLEGFTYDHFDGHSWTTSLAYSQAYSANAPMPVDNDRADNSQVTTAITVVQPPEGTKHYIFGPPQPITFDTATAAYSDGTTGAWVQQNPLVKGERYTVTSMQTTSDSALLSAVPLPAASQDLWHNDKNYASLAMDYMQVPQDLSPNVQNTMKQWTRGATDAYSALKMLEAHLSDQAVFTYSITNAPVPGNTDAVDWLLQTRSGYCTYYATTMAVMARQMGIPTRVVNGFSQGHIDQARHVWAVDGQDAHSWVQAYLPSFGWVNFDPTPGFAPNATPTSSKLPPSTKVAPKPTPIITPSPAAIKNQTHPPISPTPTTRPPIKQPLEKQNSVNQGALLGTSILVLFLSLLIFIMAIASYWWRNLYAENSFTSAMFWRLCRIATWAGLAPRSSQTPYEYSGMLSTQFPQQAPFLWRLTELFVYERWGPSRQKASNSRR